MSWCIFFWMFTFVSYVSQTLRWLIPENKHLQKPINRSLWFSLFLLLTTNIIQWLNRWWFEKKYRKTKLGIEFLSTQQWRLSYTLLWFIEHNLECYMIIYWEIVGYVVWTPILTVFWMISWYVPPFDLNNFTRKNTISHKVQHALLVKLFGTWK
jgi:hypothetical protein